MCVYNDCMSTTKSSPMAVWMSLMALVMDNKNLAQTLLEDHFELPWSRYRALRRVEQHPFTQRELAAAMHVDASAVSGIVGDLVDHGYVERVAHPDDARMKLVQITPVGEDLMDRLRGLPGVVPPPVSRLTAGERRELVALIEKMRDGAES